MVSVSILEMYATQFESIIKVPERVSRVRYYAANNEAATVKNEESKSEKVKPRINYSAGPHCVFNSLVK